MKRSFKYLVVIILLGIVSFLVIHTYQSYQAKREIGDRIKTLQHCCFASLNGGQNCIDEFDPRKPTVIIYFHPECEHCQYEASEIGKNPEQFAKANMIMITPDDSTQRVEDFAVRYHLWQIDNLTILVDRNSTFKKFFGTSIIPSVFIYGSDKRLLKKYNGETKIEAIINSIN